MTTTLPLIATVKIDTRRDGAISWARVRVILDGVETAADFRARLGEEPVVIDGDTITVSDEQIDRIRRAHAYAAAEVAARAASDAAAIEARIVKLDDLLTRKNASPAAAEELRAFYRANAAVALDLSAGPARTRFDAEVRAIMTRHGLLG